MNSALHSTRRLAMAFALSLLAPLSASAGDYYVDAVNGVDTNGGTSPADAWRTISHAMTQLPGWDQRVHLAPGVYDTALGESFPIQLHQRATLVGDAGAEVTIIDAGGASLLLDASDVDHACLASVWLRNAVVGIDAELAWGHGGWVELEDVRISDMQRGVSASVMGMDVGTTTVLRVELLRTTIADCTDAGLFLRAMSFSGDDWAFALLDATDSRFEGCGVGVDGGSDPYQESSTSVLLRGCVVAHNGIGLRADELEVSRSTIANNSAVGVCALHWLLMENSIVALNGDDLGCVGAQSTIAYTNVGDGSAGNMHGNIAADPDFLDPAGGDYRLRFWSPCADAGAPDYGLPTHDGDLDTVERLDMGARELAPLAVRAAPGVGEPLELELWGPAGGVALVYVTTGLPMESPELTPFGQLDLQRSRAVLYGVGTTAPGPPGSMSVPVQGDFAFERSTFSFQALSTSSVGSPPFAWTNVVTVTVAP